MGSSREPVPFCIFGSRTEGSKPRSMAMPRPTNAMPMTRVTHGRRSSIERAKALRSTPRMKNTVMNPAETDRPTARARRDAAPRIAGGVLHAEEVRQVRRQHGEPARVDRGHHARR